MRELAIALLYDDEGITYSAWQLLVTYISDEADIIAQIQVLEGRVFLPYSFTDGEPHEES